jgi:hypothetical protein
LEAARAAISGRIALVVLPDELGKDAYDYYRVREPLVASGLRCDVVPCLDADFASEKSLPGTIPYAVVREGRLLYRRTGERQA